MAIKVKSKKPPQGAGRPKKKNKAGHHKKTSAHASPAGPKPASAPKSLLAKKPTHKAHGKKPFVRTALHAEPAKKRAVARLPMLPREFTVAAEPAAHLSSSKKKKKKNQVALRFTENTLRDIAALECVRRCFH